MMTVGEARPVNSSSLDSFRPMSTKGRRTSAGMSPCFDTSGSYFSMYIRTVAPTEPESIQTIGKQAFGVFVCVCGRMRCESVKERSMAA